MVFTLAFEYFSTRLDLHRLPHHIDMLCRPHQNNFDGDDSSAKLMGKSDFNRGFIQKEGRKHTQRSKTSGYKRPA
jgi:hypothetical protein